MMCEHKTASVAPRLRFPGFRRDWTEQPLGQFLAESRIPGSDGSVARKLTVKLWGNGVVAKTETTSGSASTQYYKRKAGQLIYSKLDFLNGAFGVVPDHLDGFESTADLPCFDVAASLDAKFLFEFVRRRDFYKRFGEIADGGRKAKRIQVESFLSFPIAIPETTEEQRKIAACLTSLDDVIAAQARKLKALKAHRQGLMQRLFPGEGESVPRLRFPEFRQSADWTVVPLGELLMGKPQYGVNAPAVGYSASLPTYLRITDIDDDGRFTVEGRASVEIDVTDDDFMSEGDIALARTGASVGKSYRYRPEDGRLVFAGFLIRIRPDQRRILPAFLASFLTTERYWDWIRSTSARSGQPGVNGTEYATLPVPIPPTGNSQCGLAEQKRIGDCLASLDAQVIAATDKLARLKRHKHGLLQQLFPLPEGQS